MDWIDSNFVFVAVQKDYEMVIRMDYAGCEGHYQRDCASSDRSYEYHTEEVMFKQSWISLRTYYPKD